MIGVVFGSLAYWRLTYIAAQSATGILPRSSGVGIDLGLKTGGVLRDICPSAKYKLTLTMAKRSFGCEEDAQKKQRELCLESGYILRAYEEEDTEWGKHNCIAKTKEVVKDQ